MSVRRFLIPLAVALLAARCGDGAFPTAVRQPPLAPHLVRWAGSAPRFAAVGATTDGWTQGGSLLSASLDGLSLGQYSASFWAVRGETRSLQLNYQSATGDTTAEFLRLSVTDPAWVPGVGILAPGDSVLLTVTVDTAAIKITLEPTGLVFGTPAQLEVSYAGAAGDLNGDGVVDGTDAYIQTQLLGLWYREDADSAWAPIAATQSVATQTFTSALPHFSDWAVSW